MTTITTSVATALVSLLANIIVSTTMIAQEPATHVTVGAGLVVPNNSLDEYGAGVAGRVGIERWAPMSHWRFRLDGELASLPVSAAGRATQKRGLIAPGLFWNALGGSTRASVAPYVLIGAGVQALIPRGSDAYAGGLFSARLGGGLRTKIGGVHVSVESAPQLGLLSNFGTVSRGFGVFWPTTLSVSFW